MNIEIRIIKDNEFKLILDLIEKTFNKFVAPYYTEEGLSCFKEEYFNFDCMYQKYKSEKWQFIGAFTNEKLVGVLTGKKNYIEMFFIDENYQHLGIGKKMFEFYINDKYNDIGLYSAHDAVGFYEKLGFKKITDECNDRGMLITPMIYKTMDKKELHPVGNSIKK